MGRADAITTKNQSIRVRSPASPTKQVNASAPTPTTIVAASPKAATPTATIATNLPHTDATTIDPTTQAPTVIVDPDGNRTRLVQGEDVTNFTYDPRGTLTRIKTPDGSVFTLFYDSDVNLTQVKHNGKPITTDYVLGLTSDTRTTVDALRREQPRFLPALAPQFTRLAFQFALKFAIDYWSKHSTPDRSASPNRTAKQAADPSYCPLPGYGDTQPKPPVGPLIYPPVPEDDKSDSSTTTPGENLSVPNHTGGEQIKIPSSGSNVTFIPMLVQHCITIGVK